MKKLFYSLVLCVIAALPAFAQETVTVYDGDATNGYVPIYGYYADAYQKIDMVMPAADLSELTGATLTKLTWYLTTPAADAWGGNFQIYLMEVDYATPTAYADVTNATLVYEGALAATSETLEIEFANDYNYDGGNLLIAVRQTATGSYKSATFAGTAVTGAAIQGYNYSSLDAVNMNTRDFLPKTTFEFVPSSGVVYYKPKNVQVSEIGTNSAVLTWDAGADEASWVVEYKKAADEEWTNAGTLSERTYAFDALENGTKYEVRVKSIYADGESGWTLASFATLACEESDMGEVEYTLTDTYGDGWNGGAKLQIFLAGTDVLVQELALPNGSGNSELTGTFKLCYGVDYDLVWVAGTYNYEDGWTLIGPEGETISEFHGTGSSDGGTPTPGVLTTFQIHMNTCPRPTDVVVENITYNSALVSWVAGAEDQDAWQVIYAKGEVEADAIDMEPINVSDPFYTITGLEENSTYSVYVRTNCGEEQSRWTNVVTFTTPLQFPLAENLAVTNITKNSAEANWTGEAETYNFRYRPVTGLNESFENEITTMQYLDNDGDGNTWQILKITDWNMGGVALTAADGDYCIVSESVTIEGSTAVTGDNWLISGEADLAGTLSVSAADLGANYVENFSVMVSTTGTAPEDFTELGTATTAGALNTWTKFEYDLSAYEGQKGYIAIRHQPNGSTGYILMIDDVKIAGEDVPAAEWIVMEGVTSPVTMEGLEPGTLYECQVQGNYDAKATSQWTESVKFVTTAADAMPTSVTVDNITATTADVNVLGSQDLYNIRYRTAAIHYGVVEDFTGYSNGEVPTGWTVIDNDGDGNNWSVTYVNMNDGTTQITLSSASYINNVGALTPDNWIITPQSTLGETVSFDAWGQDANYAAEHFQVYVSTTGTDIADFSAISEEITTTGTKTNYEFDLGPYAGEQGYIAIRHFNCTDMFRLNVSNFYMAGDQEDVPAGEWIEVDNVEVPYTIEGLTPATEYEVQVQGIVAAKATTEWTNSVFFTTLEGEETAPYYLVGTFNGWSQVDGMIEFVDNKAENVVLEAEAEFKVITFDETGATVWYGGVDDNQVGYFLINEALYGVNITLVDGANFRIAEAGTYNLELVYDREDGIPMLKVTQTNPDAISTIAVDSQSNEWYNLNGQKLNGKPVTPGIYINGNKKVVIR